MNRPVSTVGFFGDSFCQDICNPHSLEHHYETYLQIVRDHWQAEICCVGRGGSSAWDLVLLQWPQQLVQCVPDVCVMVWPDYHRLFDRQCRNINWRSSQYVQTPQHEAARAYYQHLYDDEKHLREYQALLYHFDCVHLTQYPHTRFIHLWSFGEISEDQSQRVYVHEWQHGTTILPALETLSLAPHHTELPEQDPRANHIAGRAANQWIADQIIQAVEQYPQPKSPGA